MLTTFFFSFFLDFGILKVEIQKRGGVKNE
jgi:hypothetical protein